MSGSLSQHSDAVDQLATHLQRLPPPSSSAATETSGATEAEQTAASLPPITSPHHGKTLTLQGRGNWKIHSCPFASTPTSATPPSIPPSRCPFHLWTHTPPPAKLPVHAVHAHSPRPLVDRHGDYNRSLESALLLRGVGGGQKILEMATRFYAWALVDEHLKEFFFEADGAAAHGDRLGHWIVQFMGGEGNPWDDSGREGMRQMTHVKAWNSIHRPPQRKGRHFKLDDCRIWMRLHFLAAREVGLFLFPQFQQWYVAFIAHFVAVYEVTAPPYAAADAEWSASADNVQRYLAQGRRMLDISRSFTFRARASAQNWMRSLAGDSTYAAMTAPMPRSCNPPQQNYDCR